MVDRIDMARQIIEETCPDRRLHLENIQMFAEIIECRKFAKGDVIINEGFQEGIHRLNIVTVEGLLGKGNLFDLLRCKHR